ncbi:mitochondrial DNA polymerase beta-PAK, putative [Leishmania guyanensis]
MRFFISSAVPRTGCSLRCRLANPLSVVAAVLVAASLSCADSQRLAHGPSRWCSTWLRAGGHLSETLAIQSASSAVTASLTAQRRGVSSTTSASADAAATAASAVAAVAALSTGTKLRHRRGAHRKRGRVSATAGVTLPPDVQLGDAKSGTCAVAIDPVVSTTVLVNPSKVSSEPLSQRAVKSSGLAARGACARTLGDVAAEAKSPAVTTAAYLNGLGTSAEKPMACPPSAGEADAAEPALAASVAATDAAEMAAPRRKGRGRKPQRGANGGRTAVEAATEATVESLAVAAPAAASSPAVATPLAEVSAEAIAMAAAVSPVKPSRGLTKRRLRRREPGAAPAASAGDVETNEVKTASVAVVPSATVGPNRAPSVTADVGEGKGGTPVAESVSAAAPPLPPQHVDATCRAVTPDADAVEGGVSSRSSSSSSRRRIGRQRRQKSVGEPVSAKGTEALQGNDEVSRAADVDGDRNHTSEDGSARQSGRRQRSSSRTRSGKRLRATSPTADIGAVGKGAIAAAVAKSAAEGVRGAAEQAPVTGGATAGGATLASFSLLTTATPPQPASKTTTTSFTTVDTKAPAAFTAELGSSESKTGADVELSAVAVGTTATSCASRGNRRPRGNRMKGRHRVSAAVTDGSGDTATAAAGPAATAAVEDGETATTPPSAATVSSASVDSFKKLFATVDVAAVEAAKGLSSLAAKKRLAAQIIRRRWQLQRGLKLSPQTLPSTTTSTADEASTTATSAAAKDDEVAAAEAAAPTSSAPSSSPSSRRRLKRGKKSALVEAAVLSLTAAELLPEKPARGGEAPVAGGVKPKSRTTKRGGKLGGSAAKRHGAGTTAIAAAASGAPVAEPTKAAEVEDAVRDAEAEADVAAAMATAVELASRPEVVNDEFSLALQTDDGAVADTTSIPHSLAALVPSRASQKSKLYGAGDLKVTSGAKGSSSSGSTGGSGNCAGGSSSSGSGSSGKAGKGANSKDTLFFPDYRERVVQLFEQLAQINSALGERFKSQSYGRTVEHLKRGDKVFQLLPPNLLPLPEDDPEKKAAVEALYKDDSAAQKRRAEEVERNRAKRSLVLSPDNLIPGLGTKLREKVIEILVTGGLEELHRQEAKPIIRAIRELTQVHGVGPRTAIDYFKKHDISTVAQLRDYAIKAGELDMNNKDSGKPSNLVACSDKSKFHLNDAQRLGLVYYEDMCHRIPHDEGRLHEAFMKLRMRKYLGKDYELVVCGSYRRQVESAGDIDVLITHKRSAAEGSSGDSSSGGRLLLPPSEVLGAFLAGLKADKYIEATLAQGPTKFMGLCRLRAVENTSAAAATGKGKAAKAKNTARPKFRARRLDVRYVDSDGFPAAMLYFTGSKNFNVIMRSEAIKKHCILNEYGLFRKPTRKQMQQYGVLQRNPNMTFHDMVTRLARFDLSAIKGGEDELTSEPSAVPADASTAAGSGAGSNADGASAKVTAAAKKVKGKGREKTKQELAELREMARIVERQRVKASTEREIFEALGMDYVSPKDRSV